MRCLISRWRISRALDENDPSRLPQRHMECCPACCEFHRQSQALGERLTLEAQVRTDAYKRGAMPTLHVGGHASSKQVWKYAFAAGAAVAACVIVAIVIAMANRPQAPSKPIVKNSSPTPAPVKMSALEVRLPSISGSEAVDAVASFARRSVANQVDQASADAAATGKVLLSYIAIDTSAYRNPDHQAE